MSSKPRSDFMTSWKSTIKFQPPYQNYFLNSSLNSGHQDGSFDVSGDSLGPLGAKLAIFRRGHASPGLYHPPFVWRSFIKSPTCTQFYTLLIKTKQTVTTRHTSREDPNWVTQYNFAYLIKLDLMNMRLLFHKSFSPSKINHATTFMYQK